MYKEPSRFGVPFEKLLLWLKPDKITQAAKIIKHLRSLLQLSNCVDKKSHSRYTLLIKWPDYPNVVIVQHRWKSIANSPNEWIYGLGNLEIFNCKIVTLVANEQFHTSKSQTFPNNLFGCNFKFWIRMDQANESIESTRLDNTHAFGKDVLHTANLKYAPSENGRLVTRMVRLQSDAGEARFLPKIDEHNHKINTQLTVN